MKLVVKILKVCIVILLLLGYQNGALAKAIAIPLAEDSLTVLHFQTNDSLVYSQEDFANILSNHPEFLFKETFAPTLSYHLQRDMEFSSEAGRDNYCMLYSYFLMQVNGEQKYAAQRKRLFQLFSKINELFALIEQGGTYFGHQHKRLLAEVEYAIYLMPKDKSEFRKKYAIDKQKQLYIQGLRQLVADETANNNGIEPQWKLSQIKRLNKVIDNINQLITDNLSLRRAQYFQSNYYEY
ncbi:hypothetical protein BCY89_18985 [Sphingobacterium siyangense]|uniref:Uncharacterized protein n=2 Tax=Sphingobacterium siyangense TaxID=459529 RepID=A0A420FDH2_9SPHI|nr:MULTISPECIES: hypothetical protein [Sphingobacterium]QQT29476.1 hypothetical protein I6I99_19320 [Sphingobacterium multivorum]RKF31007.1 hypothetical protein BCY89_18985 [Sphingobacterium siyangense]